MNRMNPLLSFMVHFNFKKFLFLLFKFFLIEIAFWTLINSLNRGNFLTSWSYYFYSLTELVHDVQLRGIQGGRRREGSTVDGFTCGLDVPPVFEVNIISCSFHVRMLGRG